MPIFFYHFAWTLLFLFCVPLIPLFRKKRFMERLALDLPPDPPFEGSIWIHALSVGEVISSLPLVNALGLQYPDRDIVFSVTTSKGMSIARRELQGKVSALLTMPIDFWWSARRMVDYVRPSLFVLVETDIWPALLDRLKKRGVDSILVNGRVSPRTFKAYRRFPLFARMMFDRPEFCLVQSDLDRERLLNVGVDPDKVRRVGNIKFDREWVPMGEKERLERSKLLGLGPEDQIWVAGSTHSGEDEILLEVFGRLRPRFATLRLIIAPRRIERSRSILEMAQDRGFRAALKTSLPENDGPHDVLILDTLGELGRYYGIGSVSFVGGSLAPVGGHNLLEPASFGCPVLFGPHTHNFVVMSESLVEAGGGWRVSDGEGLFRAMKTLLTDPGVCLDMGEHARAFVEKNRGALERVVSYVDHCMKQHGGLG